uniref:ARID domain-containing protein n=1 Tax=Caenorhabditis tropicalis TaxID=1561998 RepID=A0A1I7T852_9PELO
MSPSNHSPSNSSEFSDIEKVGDIVRPSSATALLSSLSTSSSGIGESLRSPSAELSMTSEAGTSCASTPTTATTFPPLIEESSAIEEETIEEGGGAADVSIGKLVKSSIVVPSPSDTPSVTPAIETIESGKKRRREEVERDEEEEERPTSSESIVERRIQETEEIQKQQEDSEDSLLHQPGPSKEPLEREECSNANDESSIVENSPTQDGVLPSTSSGAPEIQPTSPGDMTSSSSSRNPFRKLRYSLRLPAKAALRLKRIASFQPGSLRRIGLSALKISEGDTVRLADGPPPNLPVTPEVPLEVKSPCIPSQDHPREQSTLSHQLPMIVPQQPPPPQVPPHMLQPPPGHPGHPGHPMGRIPQQLLPQHHPGINQGHATFIKQEPISQFTPQPQHTPQHPMHSQQQQQQQQQIPPQYPPGVQPHPHQMHPGMRQITAEEFAQMRAREGYIKQELASSSGQPTPVPGTPQPQQMTPQPGPLSQGVPQGPPNGGPQNNGPPMGHPPMNPQQQRIQQQQTPNASSSPLLVNLLSNQQPPSQQPAQPYGGPRELNMQQIAIFQQQQQQQAAAAAAQQQQQQQYQQRMLQQQQQQQAMLQQQQGQPQQGQQGQAGQPPPTTPNSALPQQGPPQGYFAGQPGPPPGTPGGRPIPPFGMGQPPMYTAGPQGQMIQRMPSYPGNAGPQQFRPPPPQQQQQPPQQQQQQEAQDAVVAEPPKKKKRPTRKQKETAAALEKQQQQQQQQQQQMQAYYGQQQQQQQQERMQMMQQQQQQQQGQMVQQYPGQGYPGMPPPPPQGGFPPGYHPGGPPPTQQQQQMWHHQQQQMQQQRMAMFQQQQGQQGQGGQQPMGQWQQRPLPVPYPPGTNQMPSDPNQQQQHTPNQANAIQMQHRLSGEFALPPGSSGDGQQQFTPNQTPQHPGGFQRSDSTASVYSGSQTPLFGPQGAPGAQQQGTSQAGPPQTQSSDIGEKAIVDQFLNCSDPLADLGDLSDLGELDLDPLIQDMQEQKPGTSNGDKGERLGSEGLDASITEIVDQVARAGRARPNSAELAAVSEIRPPLLHLPPSIKSPGGRNLSHEHNRRAHAFHGANRGDQNGTTISTVRLVNGQDAKKVFQTNGTSRPNQMQPQMGHMQQQQQPQHILKGEDDNNEAKIAAFAKTISEKDKKIKAAAENKTKLQAKSSRKPRSTKKATNAGPPGMVLQQQHPQQMSLQHQQMQQQQQHPNAQMMMQGHPGHMQMHPQMHMQMQMHPQHHQQQQQQQHHEEMMMQHHQQQQHLHQVPLHHMPPPPSLQSHPNHGLPQQQQQQPPQPVSAPPQPQPQSQSQA